MVQVIWWLPLAAALWLLPGYVLLRLAGVRGVFSIGAAASVTTVFVALATTLYPYIGVGWDIGSAALGWVCVAVAAWAIRWLFRRVRMGIAGQRSGRGPSDGPDGTSSPQVPCSANAFIVSLPRRTTVIAWSAGAAAALISLVGVLAALPDLAAPLQVRDGFVHLNAVAHIASSGQASMFGGLDAVVSHAGAGTYYPSAWHAVTALMPAMVPAQAVTISALAVMAAVWPISIFFLVRVAFPRQVALSVIVVALSSSLSFFPFTQHILSAQSPNALGTALLPAALAATILVVRKPRSGLYGVLLALTGAAAVFAHPNTIFSYLALALPIVAGALWRAGRRWLDRRSTSGGLGAQERGSTRPRWSAWWWVAAGAVLVSVALVAFIRFSPLWPVLRAVMNYEQTIETRSYLFTTSRLLSDVALWQLPGNIIISVAVIVGVVTLLRRRSSRWLVAMWGMTIVLAALAGGPENALRGLTGFWYKHVFRLEALYPISALLLAAVGLLVIARWLAVHGGAWRVARKGGVARAQRGVRGAALGWSRPRATAGITVVTVVLSVGTQLPGMVQRSRGVFDPAALAARDALIVDVDDRDLLDRLARLLPPGAVVIADPMSGGVLASGLGGVAAVYQRTNLTGLSPDAAYLSEHFASLDTDPQVCEALRATGVEYAYLDDDLLAGGARSAQVTAGFAAVDTSRGLEEIARSGSAALYQITACR
ncbi:hypothetical protein SAMN06309944_0854 [Micrococcales bacterium KH10]|nr:hypothetical protein SAMN06309944_0854 [Micrococcales bacterium KH10]